MSQSPLTSSSSAAPFCKSFSIIDAKRHKKELWVECSIETIMKHCIEHETEVVGFVYKILTEEFKEESVDLFFDAFIKGTK